MTQIRSKLHRSRATLLAGWLALSSLSLQATPVHAEEQLIDRVVAVIDNQIILQSQLNLQMQEQMMQLQAQKIPMPNLETLQQKVLDQMILETVQLNRASEQGIKISDDEINQRLGMIANQNNLNLLQLRDRLNAQNPNGFSELRNQIEKQLLIQKLREVEVIGRTQVTESEINNYLKRQSLSSMEVHLNHILIALPESATPEQRKTALEQTQSLRKRLIAGEDFNQLAVRYSNGSKALQGGDLGWMSPEQIPTFFSDAASRLQAGGISQIIQSPSGFHLIKVVDKRDGTDQKVPEFHLHQFLVLSENSLKQQPPESLVKITQKIRSLEDFGQLQQQFADIPKEVNRNSDLGWRTLEQIPAPLRQVIQSMPASSAIGPFANEKGWLIVFLEEQRLKSKNEMDRTQQAVKAVRMRKANEMFDVWLRRLRDEAYIRIQLDQNSAS